MEFFGVKFLIKESSHVFNNFLHGFLHTKITGCGAICGELKYKNFVFFLPVFVVFLWPIQVCVRLCHKLRIVSYFTYLVHNNKNQKSYE